jgi:hypothetical protein
MRWKKSSTKGDSHLPSDCHLAGSYFWAVPLGNFASSLLRGEIPSQLSRSLSSYTSRTKSVQAFFYGDIHHFGTNMPDLKGWLFVDCSQMDAG